MIQRTKVWPLKECPGYNAYGHEITLQPGVPGWMDMEDAQEAEEQGLVDIMAGKQPRHLREPVYQTASITPEPKRRGRPRKNPDAKRYTRTDIRAET